MAVYSVEISEKAFRELAALPLKTRERIGVAISALAVNPRPVGVTAIKGQAGHFRVRVGDYRVIYSVADAVLRVIVVRVGHRREVYRGL